MSFGLKKYQAPDLAMWMRRGYAVDGCHLPTGQAINGRRNLAIRWHEFMWLIAHVSDLQASQISRR